MDGRLCGGLRQIAGLAGSRALLTSTDRRHRGLSALAPVAACGQYLPGFAKQGWNGCFIRVCDAAHLAAHPGQTMKSVAVLMKPITGRGVRRFRPAVPTRAETPRFPYAGTPGKLGHGLAAEGFACYLKPPCPRPY
ncbi:MAG: hypothetical protein ACREDT_00355 [Methylocella sp.]